MTRECVPRAHELVEPTQKNRRTSQKHATCVWGTAVGKPVLTVYRPSDRPSGYAMRPSDFCFASGASRVIMPGPCRRA